MFIVGALVSLAGVWAYTELGCMRPYSGGEKEYLEYANQKTRGLFAY